MTISPRPFASAMLASLVCLFALPGEVVRANHVNCGDVITTDTVLDADLTCAGPGLIIGADNITLDLNGHTLTGLCTPTCGGPDGVRVNGHSGVTIMNGYITGFLFGIRLIGASDNLIDHVVTTDNAFNGISLFSGSDSNLVTHCDSSNNTNFGIIMTNGSDDNVVQHCALIGNGTGVFVGGGPTGGPSFRNHIAQNRSRDNRQGIHLRNADENLIERNVVAANDLGILISEGADRNVVQHNIVNHSGRDGLLVDLAIMPGFTEPDDNQFVRNRLHGNGTSGDPGARDISDHTTGDGALGTRNAYDGNQCGISFPDGLCGF
jgi:parallel beta-helix repeat protein